MLPQIQGLQASTAKAYQMAKTAIFPIVWGDSVGAAMF